jgi:hypothetical protein
LRRRAVTTILMTVDTDAVPMGLSLLLIGVSGVAAAVAGLLLPPGRRLEALLGPVAGAGAGLAGLAVGVLAGADDEAVWFLGSTGVGVAATLAVLAALVRWRTPTDDG